MCRSIGLILLALFFMQSLSFGQSTALWLNLHRQSDPFFGEFERLLLKQAALKDFFPIRRLNIPPESLKSQLLSMKQQEQKPPVILYCHLEDYARLLKDPEAKSLFADFQIEMLNAHLISVPFYLFGYAQDKQSLQLKMSKLDTMQIAFLTLPLPQIYSVEEADLLTMLSEILAKPKNSIRIYREREAYTAAKQLFEGDYHLVGIYEDEPSTLVDEFQINLVQELNAHQAQMLPLDRPRVAYHLHEVSPQRFKYVFFVDEQDPMFPIAGVVQETGHDFPILLSNIHTAYAGLQSKFSKVLSDAYFLMIPKISELRFHNETEKQNVQRMYLLNAYLDDPENRYKSLGFLGYLLLMKDKKWDDPREKEVYEQKCELFLRKLKLNRITADSLFEWLDLKIPKIEKRELFTDDVSRLYQNAISKIDQGLRSKEKRKENFQQARRFLIAALLQGDEPKNVKGSRGLWSVKDYNPYYQLARVTLYLENEK